MEKNSSASRVVHMEKHEHGGSKEAADQEAKRSINTSLAVQSLPRSQRDAGADFPRLFLFRAIFYLFSCLFRAIFCLFSWEFGVGTCGHT